MFSEATERTVMKLVLAREAHVVLNQDEFSEGRRRVLETKSDTRRRGRGSEGRPLGYDSEGNECSRQKGCSHRPDLGSGQ